MSRFFVFFFSLFLEVFFQHYGLHQILSTEAADSVLHVSKRWADSFSSGDRLTDRRTDRDAHRACFGSWEWGGMGSVRYGRSCASLYPSVPFLLGALAFTAVPSGCWPSLRGGILSFILSRPRASSKLRIFLVGEKPWMAGEQTAGGGGIKIEREDKLESL